jgi:hypothetical protein
MKAYKGVNLKFRGVIFNEWAEDQEEGFLYNDQDGNTVENEGEGCHYWSGICKEHVNKYSLGDDLLDEGGSGTCGIKGCNREADYYIDFHDSEIEFVKARGAKVLLKLVSKELDYRDHAVNERWNDIFYDINTEELQDIEQFLKAQ